MGWLLFLFRVRLAAFTADTLLIDHSDAGAVAAQDALGEIDFIPIRRRI
jgi:hypothetical protein